VLGFLHLLSLLLNKPLPHNPDLHGYLIPTVLVSGLGLTTLLGHVEARGFRRLWPLALGLPMLALAGDGPWLVARAHGIHSARILADAYLDDAPPRAIVVLLTDHLYFPMLYRQEAENARPDVLLINLGLIKNPWFWKHQRARHPELAEALTADVAPAEQLTRIVQKYPELPVVAQASVLLRGLGRGLCEGTFLSRVVPPSGTCPPVDLDRRLAIVTKMAQDLRGDWIGERMLATQAIMLAMESRTSGARTRAAATLAASSRELLDFATPAPAAGLNLERLRQLPLRRLPEDALASPDWVLYLLGRMLVDLGDARGEELLATARSRGVVAAALDLEAAGGN
jgi:hypothetical protein